MSLGLPIRVALSYFSSIISNGLTSKTMSKPPVNILSLIRVAWVKVSLYKRAVTKTVSTSIPSSGAPFLTRISQADPPPPVSPPISPLSLGCPESSR